MEFDPHSLHQIIQRIYQQMRCPQCSKRIPVDFASVRMAGQDFLLLQLRCETCDAHIVLNASLQGAEVLSTPADEALTNASSSLQLSTEEVSQLHHALEGCDGSFDRLFKEYGKSMDDLSAPDASQIA